MIYLWESQLTGYPERLIGKYEGDYSTSYFALYQGEPISQERFSRCDLYVRSQTLDLPDDPLIRFQLRPARNSAYIFAPDAMFYFDGYGMANRIKIDAKSLNWLKEKLGVSDADIDQPPRALSDAELAIIVSIDACPKFSRIPVITFEGTRSRMVRYDCLPNSSASPLVNNKVRVILEKLAPDDVQFFPAKVICTDGELSGYKLVNLTRTIIGIDHEKSQYKRRPLSSDTFDYSFKYLTYKPGCMQGHKLARDQESKGHILVTEEVKKVFDEEGITGLTLITPEEFYEELYPPR